MLAIYPVVRVKNINDAITSRNGHSFVGRTYYVVEKCANISEGKTEEGRRNTDIHTCFRYFSIRLVEKRGAQHC